MRRILALLIVCVLLAGSGYVAYLKLREARPADAPSAAGQPQKTIPDARASDPPAQPSGQPTAVDATSSGNDRPPAAPVRWFNIAAAALGGRVEHVSSVSADEGVFRPVNGWAPANLIDGGTADTPCSPLCGWASKDSTFPIDIVLSFYQQREAVVGRVAIDTLTEPTRSSSDRVPKQVEISVSRSSATDGFVPVASVELPSETAERVVDFAPTPARYLRVRILSSHGGERVVLSEIGVFEAEGPAASILADFPRNLALPALGGAIVSASYNVGNDAFRLIDGDPAREWRSRDGSFPQDIIFAVRGDAVALIDRMVLASAKPSPAAPKVVSVSVSLDSPVEGFEDVGRFTLKNIAGDQTLPIQRRARFVKLRILENFGLGWLNDLGEVQLIEGTEPGYESLLSRRLENEQRPAATDAADGAANDDGAAAEQEKNDDAAQANRLDLGGAVRGRIEPIGESDCFKVSFPGPDRSVLTVDLSGRPNIRTSLDLVDARGAIAKRFDPARVRAQETAFSWLMDPGEYTFRLTQPPASIVVVWDTSGSMKNSVKDLQRAVAGFLDQVSPAERVNLIRFSKAGWTLARPDIETLLPEFSNDRQQLKKAAEGKFEADGGTPFYDAVAKASALLDKVQGNRAIVVMTDGEDSGSKLERHEFWQLLQDKGIRLYTIGLGEIDRYSARLAASPARLLAHAALVTNGRSFFSRNSADLAKFYQAISEDLRKTSTYRLKVSASRATGTLDVRIAGERLAGVAAPSQIELILDASGSMKRTLGGRMMIDTAKTVLSDIVQQLPDDMHVALRVYGHRIREGRPGACEDSQLMFPFAKLNRQALLSKIHGVRALGTTPIAYSLQQVARDVGQTAGEKMIVLVTDGKEECGGDPSAAVAALMAQGINVKLNVVGFALADAALKAELRRLAEQTKGQFVEAKDAVSLRAAIEQSLAVPYDVLDATDTKVAEGVTGQAVTKLPEGVYTVRVRAGKPIDVANVRIAAQQTTTIELKKEGQEVGVHVVGARRGGR
jgi:Mg-chelatase subunit ChlD